MATFFVTTNHGYGDDASTGVLVEADSYSTVASGSGYSSDTLLVFYKTKQVPNGSPQTVTAATFKQWDAVSLEDEG
jgi:hypothetical protein